MNALDGQEAPSSSRTSHPEYIPDRLDPHVLNEEPTRSSEAMPTARQAEQRSNETPKITVENVHFRYGDGTQALKGISMRILPYQVTALIGPSGCGKSTLLRCFNRMNELLPDTLLEGTVRLDGQNIYDASTDPVMVRRRVGMVFQKPNPFPKSVYDNVAWGAKINGYHGDMDQLVEQVLRQAALWGEVKDRLQSNAYGLSGGQQQRLCIARALATRPDVLLMDEPASALDPIATAKVEDTIEELKRNYTIVIVTHNMQQAARISEDTAFLYMGKLVEMGPTQNIFNQPEHDRTQAYVTGQIG